MAADRAEELQAMQAPATGKAGWHVDVHSLAAGSSPQQRLRPAAYICVYSAGDAIPLARNPMPSRFEGTIVRGQDPGTARMMPLQVELPKQPKSASHGPGAGLGGGIGRDIRGHGQNPPKSATHH